MKKLKIWLFQTGETLPLQEGMRKMRTALLADSLVKRGHQVLWFASGFEHQRKAWLSKKEKDFQISSNFKIRVLCGTGYKKNISFARYIDHLIVARKFRHQSENNAKPDVIVASMPCYHLAYEAMRYASKKHIPYIIDIRDLWPDIFIDPLEKYGLKKIGRLGLYRDFKKLSLLLKKANSIVAISKGCLDWGLGKIGRSQSKWDRVFYHGYLDNPMTSGQSKLTLAPEIKDKKIFLFVGTFGESYELELIIDVARKYQAEHNSELLFYIVGTGDKFNLIKKMAHNLTNVKLTGWIDAHQIQLLLQTAWAGIVPCKSVENAAPNKVFEYLSAGLPLVSSLEGEIAEFIEQYKMGLNYRAGDAQGLYHNVKILADSSKLRQDMSQAASKFFNRYGNADQIYIAYTDLIEKLVEDFETQTELT